MCLWRWCWKQIYWATSCIKVASIQLHAVCDTITGIAIGSCAWHSFTNILQWIFFCTSFRKLTVKQDAVLCQQPLHTSAYVPWQHEAATWEGWDCVCKLAVRLTPWCNHLIVHLSEPFAALKWLTIVSWLRLTPCFRRHIELVLTHECALEHVEPYRSSAPETQLMAGFLIAQYSPAVSILVSTFLALPETTVLPSSLWPVTKLHLYPLQ